MNKKVLSKAVSQLDKAKAPAKPKDIITDPAGQWKFPGQDTRIPSNKITMKGVPYPVFAQPNVGPGIMMEPGQDYEFPDADYVDESPQMKKGGTLKLPKMPKPSKKGVLGRGYSNSLDATNKLFTEHKLFEKVKSKKGKVFDPNAKYQNGGVNSLEGDLISKVIMNRNKDKDFVQRAYALGDNPGTSMFNVPDNEQFGKNMSHKMAWGEDDNGQSWMFPTILNPNDEAIQVPNQYADYISNQGYKNATGMNQYKQGGEYIELDLTDDEIEEYRKGGYIVQDISVPSLNQ